MGMRSNVGKVIALTAICLLSALAARNGWVATPSLRLRWPWYIASASDTAQVTPGPELAFVFIDSPTCSWCNAPELPSLIALAKERVRQQAVQRDHSFASIAVSRTSSAAAGIAHLSRFGVFDEISAGRRWYNIGLLKYVYQELVGPAATPQVLVVQRVVLPNEQPGFISERILLRQVGFGPIQQWVERGAPVPRAADSTTGSSAPRALEEGSSLFPNALVPATRRGRGR